MPLACAAIAQRLESQFNLINDIPRKRLIHPLLPAIRKGDLTLLFTFSRAFEMSLFDL